jgi:hypothetical protein
MVMCFPSNPMVNVMGIGENKKKDPPYGQEGVKPEMKRKE